MILLDIFNYLSLFEFGGPIITGLAAILALLGDSYIKDNKGFRKITTQGYLSIVFAFIGIVLSIGSTIKSNQNHATEVANNFRQLASIEAKHDSTLNIVSQKDASNDSLRSVIEVLRIDLISATNESLKVERLARITRNRNLVENAIFEYSKNQEILESELSDENIDGYKGSGFFVRVKIQTKSLERLLEMELPFEVRSKILFIIEKGIDINDDISKIGSTPAGEGKDMYYRQVKRNRDEIYNSYQVIIQPLVEMFNSLVSQQRQLRLSEP